MANKVKKPAPTTDVDDKEKVVRHRIETPFMSGMRIHPKSRKCELCK